MMYVSEACIWYSQTKSLWSWVLTCAIKCTCMRQIRCQWIWLPILVVCSLRTSETNYLNESFSFYSAIRMRAYYSKANKEERWDIFISYDTAIVSFSSEHILKVHLAVWLVHLVEHWLSMIVFQGLISDFSMLDMVAEMSMVFFPGSLTCIQVSCVNTKHKFPLKLEHMNSLLGLA